MSTAISYGLLAAYLYAFAALPVLHQHTPNLESANHCGHHEQEENHSSAPADDCSVCDVLHSTVALFQLTQPVILAAEVSQNTLPLCLSLPVAEAAVLPPCRAPPAV